MKRYNETKIKNVYGRGKTYAISIPSDKLDNSLSTYTPQLGERYDNIAYKFYNDSNLWYVIAKANNDVRGTLYPVPNKTLKIPRID